jgi:hypothetical protein
MDGGPLAFGGDVGRGLDRLHDAAGPPEKVARYLRTLAELSDRFRRGPSLGMAMLRWLGDRNVSASDESETVRRSPGLRRRRTWDWGDGLGDRFYALHLKPSNAVSRDRCVRIYFDWCPERRRIVVGWVGPHPD